MRELLRRLAYLIRRNRFETELEEEIAFHRDMAEQALRAEGVAASDAADAARRAMGNIAASRDQARDIWLSPLVQGLGLDVRVALRGIRRAPVVGAAAVLSLTLGVGATTALFSIVDALLLRPLPVRSPEQLVLVRSGSAGERDAWSYPVWQEMHRRRDVFAASAAWAIVRFNRASGGESQYVDGLWVSGSYFDTLGITPRLGRMLTDADDRANGGVNGPVVVISHGFWQRRFGGAADVIGRTLRLDDVPFTIVGVTPPQFFGVTVGRTFDVAAPLAAEPLLHPSTSYLDPENGATILEVIGRLKSGDTISHATAALEASRPAIRDATVAPLLKFGQQRVDSYMKEPFALASALTGTSGLRLQYEHALVVLTAVVITVLIIACVNIANLLMARGAARRHDFALRSALGAARWRLVRQSLVESALLSAAGSCAGIVLATWLAPALVAQLSTDSNRVFLDVGLDLRLLVFTLAVTVMTTTGAGLAPAIRTSRTNPVDAADGRTLVSGARARRGSASWLVGTQVALAMVLVLVAILFVTTFARLTAQPLGFAADRVLVAAIDPQRAIEPEDRIPAYARIRDAVRQVPGVRDAAVSLVTPFSSGGYTPPIDVDGVRVTGENSVWGNPISPGWVRTLGIPLLRGRDITDADRRGRPRVALVNRLFADRYFHGGDAVGRSFRVYPNSAVELSPITIVGIVGDAAYRSPREPVRPTFYLPLDQMDLPGFPMFRKVAAPNAILSVRTEGLAPADLTHAISAAITSVNPHIVITFHSLQQQVDAALRQDLLVASLGSLFGALALLLTGIGLYGVVSYHVAQRRTEIAIRTTMGATSARIARLVLTRVAALIGVGVIVGIATAAVLGRLIAALLYGVAPHDASSVMVAATIVTSITGVAAVIPLWQALSVQPSQVLKDS